MRDRKFPLITDVTLSATTEKFWSYIKTMFTCNEQIINLPWIEGKAAEWAEKENGDKEAWTRLLTGLYDSLIDPNNEAERKVAPTACKYYAELNWETLELVRLAL